MVAHSATPRPGPSDRPSNPTHTPAGRPSGVVWFGLLPVRSPLLGESCLFLAVLRCFSSGGALLRAYRFSTGYHPLPGDGLPHSEIIGSMRGSRSPMLFAAAHVLLRHLTPRHPPHAPSSFFFTHPHRVQPLNSAWSPDPVPCRGCLTAPRMVPASFGGSLVDGPPQPRIGDAVVQRPQRADGDPPTRTRHVVSSTVKVHHPPQGLATDQRCHHTCHRVSPLGAVGTASNYTNQTPPHTTPCLGADAAFR